MSSHGCPGKVSAGSRRQLLLWRFCNVDMQEGSSGIRVMYEMVLALGQRPLICRALSYDVRKLHYTVFYCSLRNQLVSSSLNVKVSLL